MFLQTLQFEQFFRIGLATPRLAAQFGQPSRPPFGIRSSLVGIRSSLVSIRSSLVGLLQGIAEFAVTEHPLSLGVVESDPTVLLSQPKLCRL